MIVGCGALFEASKPGFCGGRMGGLLRGGFGAESARLSGSLEAAD
jgi:hypothetical protein